MTRCWIALGGNIGEVRSTLLRGMDQLRERGLPVIRQSRLYDTTPVGARSSPRYLNAAVATETELSPLEIMEVLRGIERDCGRVQGERWGPRPIDLDLLLYGAEQFVTPTLTVPHPALWYRRFALDPLAEIAPEAVHPTFGETIAQVRSVLLERRLPIRLRGTGSVVAAIRQRAGVMFAPHIVWVPEQTVAAIEFLTNGCDRPVPEPLPPRTIDLRSAEDAVELAMAVLTAAVDEPIPLD